MTRRERKKMIADAYLARFGRRDSLPVQLRTDLVVFIQGIPWDLTKREADKLRRVIMAMENETPLPPSRQLPPPTPSI